ncbi:LYR motif-containing protein 2 isoform X1 [Fundulus heteroclitus]|uniref:LYR motif-containing protein 2 isoform X1 n=1 Tax=Fundulus heteroclitus TaxID=8078 RepID=UPI00165B4BDE|nr:LYR motif-containing protein 2 isoform X1 [Fundulus heteroclitus]
MISRVPPAALSLKQFLQRQRVLALYRNMLRTIRQVPDEADRKYLRDWARDEFKRNKDATNQVLLNVGLCVSQPPISIIHWVIHCKPTSRHIVLSLAQDAIRMMITQASNHLEELQKSLALARS